MPNRNGKNQAEKPDNTARRMRRTLLTLLAALALSYVLGREFDQSNEELLGYLLASLALVIGSGLVALTLFGVIRLFRR